MNNKRYVIVITRVCDIRDVRKPFSKYYTSVPREFSKTDPRGKDFLVVGTPLYIYILYSIRITRKIDVRFLNGPYTVGNSSAKEDCTTSGGVAEYRLRLQ